VCDLYRTRRGDEKRGFFGLASKPLQLFLALGLKTSVDGLVIWASKSPRRFMGLGLKTKLEEGCQFAPEN
jgi:hypothetical protein